MYCTTVQIRCLYCLLLFLWPAGIASSPCTAASHTRERAKCRSILALVSQSVTRACVVAVSSAPSVHTSTAANALHSPMQCCCCPRCRSIGCHLLFPPPPSELPTTRYRHQLSTASPGTAASRRPWCPKTSLPERLPAALPLSPLPLRCRCAAATLPLSSCCCCLGRRRLGYRWAATTATASANGWRRPW
jgi:hypothetical protein